MPLRCRQRPDHWASTFPSRGFRRGLILICSQKTLSVAALMIPQLASEPCLPLTPSSSGIAMIVVVLVYIIQLAIDFVIASGWAMSPQKC